MLVRLLLLTAVIFWGWSFVATKIALDFVTPAELIGLRYLLGLPVMLVIIVGKGLPIRFSVHDWGTVTLAALVITVHFLLQVGGLNYTSATNTGWIISVTPLALAVLSYVFLKERIGPRAVLGVIAATAGIVMLVSRGRLGNLDWLSSVGDWLVLGSAHTWAVYAIVTRNVSRRHPPLVVTFSILAMSSIAFFMWMLATTDWNVVFDMPLRAKAAVAFLGVFCLALAFWFWQEGVARLGASRAGFFLYLEPIATTTLAVPYLHEPFGVWGIFGAVLVMGGVYIAERRPRRGRQ